MSELIDNCPLCAGAKKSGITVFSVDLGFGVVMVRNVPATVCSQCGADWISDEVAQQLESIVEEAKLKHHQVEVSTFPLSAPAPMQ